MELTKEQLQTKLDSLEQKHKELNQKLNAKQAMDDEKKNHEAKKATLKMAMDHMDDEKKARYIAAVMASDDEELKKAMSEVEKDDHKAKKATDDEDKKDSKLSARVRELEAKLATPMIQAMVSARENAGASTNEITNFKNSLMAKSYNEIETLYEIVHPLVAQAPKQETTSNPYFTTATFDQQISAKEESANITDILGGDSN